MIGTWTQDKDGIHYYHLPTLGIRMKEESDRWDVELFCVLSCGGLLDCVPMEKLDLERSKITAVIWAKKTVDHWAQQFREVL